MSVNELVRFLRRLAALYRDPKFGNPPLSEAIVELANALGRRRNMTLTQAITDLRPKQKSSLSRDASEVRNLNPAQIEKMLSDKMMSKADLIRLGTERFAISRSKLERLNIDQVSSEIAAAVRHEESLRIISQEAQRGGSDRSS